MQNLIGKKVVILNKHPWSGYAGKTVRAEIPKGFTKPAMVVALDLGGIECFVFDAKDLLFVTNSIQVNRKN